METSSCWHEKELSEASPANLDDLESTMENALSIYHQPPLKQLKKYEIRTLKAAVNKAFLLTRIKSHKVFTINLGTDTLAVDLLALGKNDDATMSGALDREILLWTSARCQL